MHIERPLFPKSLADPKFRCWELVQKYQAAFALSLTSLFEDETHMLYAIFIYANTVCSPINVQVT